MFDALLISQNSQLINEIQKISAVTQCSLEVNSKVNNSEVKAARLVLLDSAIAGTVNHPNVVLITMSEPGIEIWQKAVTTEAKYVAFLPDAREWLLQNLIPNPIRSSRVIGVLGATGGLGTSLIASSLASLFAQTNKSVVLAETNFCSGGLDVLWGIEDSKGTRWADLIYPSGRIAPQDLYRSLPKVSGVSILSTDSQDGRTPTNYSELLNDLAQAVDILIVDLAKSLDTSAVELLESCTDLVMVTGSTIRSTSATNQLMQLIPKLASAKLVVRMIPGTGLDSLNVSKTLGLELLGSVATDQKVVEHLEQGLNPSDISSNSYRKSMQEIFENLEDSNVSAVA